MSDRVSMPLEALVLDPRTQPRAEIDYALVAEYRDDRGRGDLFPPVVAWGTIERAYLSSGWHRYKAEQQLGSSEIEVELHEGTLDDAIWHSLSTNRQHGKRRSPTDIRRVIERALEMRSALSNSAIAAHCGVSHQTVGRVRAELELTCPMDKSTQRECLDGRVIETKSIGSAPRSTESTITPATLTDPTEEEIAAGVEQIEADDTAGDVARARLRLQFSHGMRAARELVMLRPDAVADVLTREQQPAVEAFCADVGAWVTELRSALRRPLRVVGGSDAAKI